MNINIYDVYVNSCELLSHTFGRAYLCRFADQKRLTGRGYRPESYIKNRVQETTMVENVGAKAEHFHILNSQFCT